MKLPVSWINTFAPCDGSKAFADKVTMNGLEVEEIYTINKEEFPQYGGAATEDELCWDVKVTPNRGDWLSVLGVAREAAIVNAEPYKLPQVKEVPFGECPVSINIKTDKCKRYLGAVIKGVKLASSPSWMANRLICAGMRPINNVVDITNYVMLELGQPLHAFDLRLLPAKEINIRSAEEGEKITTLDGVERVLDSQMTVIADEAKPVALAGVMGGENTEINDDTADVFLETAVFDCTNVRRTSKRLNLSTESSYRFERTVDVEMAEFAARYAVSLILDLCGGELEGGIKDCYPEPRKPLVIKSNPKRINTLLGMDLKPEFMAQCLKIGDIPTEFDGEYLYSTIPAYRTDLLNEIDMVEEVGRVYGYNKIGTTLPPDNLVGKSNETDEFHKKLRGVLLACGGQEILTHSMIDARQNQFADSSRQIIIRNPMQSNLDGMRQLLIPNALEIVAGNQAHQTGNINVFEIAKVYYMKDEKNPGECMHVAGAITGSLWNNGWGVNCDCAKVDFFTVKGIVETVLESVGIKNAEFRKCERSFLHPTQAAEVFADGKHLGVLGQASKEILDYAGVRGKAFVYELNFDNLMSLANNDFRYTAIDRFPTVRRDITFLADKSTSFADILQKAYDNAEDIVKEINLVDVYESDKIGKDKRSITVQIVMRADRTLTDDEATSATEKIKSVLG